MKQNKSKQNKVLEEGGEGCWDSNPESQGLPQSNFLRLDERVSGPIRPLRDYFKQDKIRSPFWI